MLRRLKSDMFMADHSVGEDSLTKDIDFHGHDIDAQFSCVSTSTSSVVELEIFGKVVVSLLDADGVEQDNTRFSFNLIKNVSKRFVTIRCATIEVYNTKLYMSVYAYIMYV